MRSRILLGTLFGAIGGFLGFVLQEVFVPHPVPPISLTRAEMMHLGIYVGAMLGIGIGIVEGVAVGSSRVLLKGMILGAVIGAIGGMMGIYFGSYIYNVALFGKDPDVSNRDLLDYIHKILARGLGWAFLGSFPGLAAGAATFSRKRASHGLLGGLVGGLIGGLLFNIVADLVANPLQGMASSAVNGTQVHETGGLSRAIGFTAIGLLTGLFIGLVEEWFKQGWVRVLAGRNEGRDYILSKPLSVLGRDERADIPLFGDPNLAPQHAAIRMERGRHALLDGGTPLGSVVNGQRVTPDQPQLLRDGDMIQLGQVRLLFREKATAAKIHRPAPDMPKGTVQTPGALAMPAHLCPYCGAPKDASGNCLCTVPGATPLPPPAPLPMTGEAAPGTYAPFPSPGFGAEGVGTRLLALEGPYVGQAFPLGGPNVTVGRSPDNMIALTNDTTISRRHAHVADEGGRHVLYDDGSSNGTFVNNVRITIQTLAQGDIVQFGASRFRYE